MLVVRRGAVEGGGGAEGGRGRERERPFRQTPESHRGVPHGLIGPHPHMRWLKRRRHKDF